MPGTLWRSILSLPRRRGSQGAQAIDAEGFANVLKQSSSDVLPVCCMPFRYFHHSFDLSNFALIAKGEKCRAVSAKTEKRDVDCS